MKFKSGDLWCVKGSHDVVTKHCIPKDKNVKDLRASICLRSVDKDFVWPDDGKFTEHGKIIQGDLRRQAHVPEMGEIIASDMGSTAFMQGVANARCNLLSMQMVRVDDGPELNMQALRRLMTNSPAWK